MAREVEAKPVNTNKASKRKSFPFSAQPSDINVDSKSIDLVSVNSLDESEADNISLAEGYMQQWNYEEFRTQFLGAFAGVILIFGCSILSSWSINEYLKLILDTRSNSTSWNSTEFEIGITDYLDDMFSSEVVMVSAIIVSYNIGVIFGGVFGAFIVPVLTNQVVYVSDG